MTSILSSLNNTNKPLNSLITFGGKYELVNAYTSYSIGIKTDSTCVITIYQSYDGVSDDDFDVFVSTTNIFANHQANLYLPYARISIFNATGTNQTYMLCTTKWMSVIPLPLQLSNVSLAPNSNVIVSSGSINVLGQTPDYIFIPTVGNNTASIYADGIQGTNVVGGWEYNNTPTGKINWYLYNGNPTTAGQSVASVSSMYAVVNNLSTLGLSQAQNPWIMIYTRPDSGTNATSWYKSKLFFGSNAFTDINGVKLLYTGTDPTDIHPEITGNNRINLLFNLSLSTKSLVDAETESILYGTLQTTNNTATPSEFYFTFSEFGISWVQQSIPLPIQDNSVVVSGNVNAKINPTASQAVRITGIGNTALLISSLGLCYGTSLINKSVTTNCWVKFYVKSTAPTSADTPFLIQYLEYVAQYNLNSHNDDWFNMPIGSNLWVRATLTSADGDTTDAGINAEATIFIGS
jgi:hypothetical protein